MISAVVLTKNNERTLSRTLESVLWCDEIIVVDDGSTDRTRDIAIKSGGKVLLHPLKSDFSQQRNFGLLQAKGEWVLFVDSDEMITEELKGEIISKIRSPKSEVEYNGYFIRRTDIMWGKELRYGETADVKLLRLAKRNSGKWVRPIHEIWDVKGKTGMLMHPLFHYPHPDVAQFLSSVNRYSTINAEYLYQKGTRVRFIDILLYPKAKFLRNYFMKLGFFDGTAGIIIALMMSFHSFLTRGKIWELQKKIKDL